ncbi:response regulator transcription factor, partial [Actinomadura fibrosa]|uniref:response regulator transcription factor n=1 Tax=Actinomadura fibrosa TaxID=111802 RepID=UPI0010418061
DGRVLAAEVDLGARVRLPHRRDLGAAEPSALRSDVQIEAWLLDVRRAFHAGDRSKARRSLDRALRLGERERTRLPFALARRWLLPALDADPELFRQHRRLIEPIGLPAGNRASGDAGAPPGAPAVFGRLSAREREVLSLLAGMRTTEEIAAEMYVSVNTVKTHLKSIYRKLAVTRRGEAVRRAQRLRLI